MEKILVIIFSESRPEVIGLEKQLIVKLVNKILTVLDIQLMLILGIMIQ